MEFPTELEWDRFGKRRSCERTRVKIDTFVGLSEKNRFDFELEPWKIATFKVKVKN